jgi:hypothetical protein
LGDLPRQGIVALMIEVGGAKSVPKLVARLSEIGVSRWFVSGTAIRLLD